MSHKAIVAIMEALKSAFAEADAAYVAKQQDWAKGRVAAIREKKAEFSASNKRWNYEELFAVAGGKTWYNIFDGRNAEMIEEIVAKNCEAIIAKRNVSIAKKLEKAEVTEVIESKLCSTVDGLNGHFVVETNKGRKGVHIETIIAGGYNIQCLHQRTLVKVR